MLYLFVIQQVAVKVAGNTMVLKLHQVSRELQWVILSVSWRENRHLRK